MLDYIYHVTSKLQKNLFFDVKTTFFCNFYATLKYTLLRDVTKSKWVWPGNVMFTHYRPAHSTMRKSQRTITAKWPSEHHTSKATSSLSLPQREDCKTILSETSIPPLDIFSYILIYMIHTWLQFTLNMKKSIKQNLSKFHLHKLKLTCSVDRLYKGTIAFHFHTNAYILTHRLKPIIPGT